MTDRLRAAAEAALEALEDMDSDDPELNQEWLGKTAITKLRAALAEPEAEQEGGDLPVRDDDGCPTEVAVLKRFWRGQPIPVEHYPQWFAAEPVAWGMRHSDGRIYDCIAPGEHDREPGQYTVPLYTAPPSREWVGLTDEEIAEVHRTCKYDASPWPLSRAIEAALKEKNG